MTPHEPSRLSPTAVAWPRCTVVYGCSGRAADPFPACVAHLRPRELRRFTGGLRPGADLDLRGCDVPAELLATILEALTGPDGRPHLGRSRFDGAFLGSATALPGACFEGDSSFDGTCLAGNASFFGARFLGHVSFRGARFAGNVSFHEARFHRHASFDEAIFVGDALFGETRWLADASFGRAVFFEAAAFDRAGFGRDLDLRGACLGGAVSLRRVRVERNARLDRTRFRRDVWLGPMTVGGRLDLTAAVAHGGLHVHADAREVTVRGAAVRGTTAFRLRGSVLDLEDAAFERPVTVNVNGTAAERAAGPQRAAADEKVRIDSLRGVSTPRLDLGDVDLSHCRFLGLQVSEVRLDHGCTFAMKRDPWWHDPRLHRRPHAVLREDRVRLERLNASELEALYRKLSRATDGGLSQDFRYRALEMRRRSDPAQWRRGILHLLWLTCGYGLRTGRLAAWLTMIIAMVVGGMTMVRHGQHPTTAHPRVHRHSGPTPGHAPAPHPPVSWRNDPAYRAGA